MLKGKQGRTETSTADPEEKEINSVLKSKLNELPHFEMRKGCDIDL